MKTLHVALLSGQKASLIEALAGLGVVAHARGDLRRAVRLLQASKSLFDKLNEKLFSNPNTRAGLEQHWAAIRAQLGEEDFSALKEEGQAMTLEQAVQYALDGGKQEVVYQSTKLG